MIVLSIILIFLAVSDRNFRAILHDERAYPNPLKFDPDRFADEENNRALGVNEIPLTAFGFGRRYDVCDPWSFEKLT